MPISRRQFLQRTGMAAAAATTVPHPLFRAMIGTAHAAPSDAILVIVQLEGGNDGLNTVVPVGASAQRTLYDGFRPNLGIPNDAALAATALGPDAGGTNVALHPVMTGMKQLFDSGKLALLNGVGYPNQNLSHFRSEDIWYGGDPIAQFSSGWFGRYLAAHFTPSDLVTYDANETLNEMFLADGTNVLAVRSIDDFILPDDSLYPDAAAKKTALQAAYGFESDPGETTGTPLSIGISGDVLFDKLDVYDPIRALINGTGNTTWGSHLNGLSGALSTRLRQVATVMKYDHDHPGTATGARFFHVRIGGFDNHTNQVNTGANGGPATGTHAGLLDKVSKGLKAFWDDVVDFGWENRVLVLTVSEFGRRVTENGGLGTDHGAAAPHFVIGGQVNGGIYGAMPDLADLDANGNLKWGIDFRSMYATVIDKWLATPGAHTAILPGGPFPTLGFLP